MKTYVKQLILLIILVGALVACEKKENDNTPNIITPSDSAILIDASNDGGCWWFPLTQETGFSPSLNHQGLKFANILRNHGFTVDELPRGTIISDALLSKYKMVIVASPFFYSESALHAYDNYLSRNNVVLLIFADYQRSGQNQLAGHIGIPLKGISRKLSGGNYCVADSFVTHPITNNVTSLNYNAGSAVLDTTNSNIEILGWLSSGCYVDLNDNEIRDPNEPVGSPVMGILHHPTAKIFFIGDINGLEETPQPLTNNLINWAFK